MMQYRIFSARKWKNVYDPVCCHSISRRLSYQQCRTSSLRHPTAVSRFASVHVQIFA